MRVRNIITIPATECGTVFDVLFGAIRSNSAVVRGAVPTEFLHRVVAWTHEILASEVSARSQPAE